MPIYRITKRQDLNPSDWALFEKGNTLRDSSFEDLVLVNILKGGSYLGFKEKGDDNRDRDNQNITLKPSSPRPASATLAPNCPWQSV